MGFWNALKKMAEGKPVFEDDTQNRETVAQATEGRTTHSPTVTPTDSHGRKIIPQLVVKHCKSAVHGSTIFVTCWLENASDLELEVETIELLGRKEVSHRRLAGHASHEFILYKGVMPSEDKHDKAAIYYRTIESNDNFCADFRIEFNQESDGLFSVEQLHPENYGVRDL